MATYIATSDIRWGKDADTVKTFHDGDTVTGPSEDQMKDLAATGAIVLRSDYRKKRSSEQDEIDAEAAEELRKRNEELQGELAVLRARLEAAEGPAKSADTTQQVAPPKPAK